MTTLAEILEEVLSENVGDETMKRFTDWAAANRGGGKIFITPLVDAIYAADRYRRQGEDHLPEGGRYTLYAALEDQGIKLTDPQLDALAGVVSAMIEETKK